MTPDVNAHAVWQVSAGPHDRTFADQCLTHGVALIGPGDTGPWCSDRSDTEFEGGFVRRFAAELGIGDVLLLRTDRSTIRAVGLVASDYQFLPQFDDVNGWDLQHARRVRWFALPNRTTLADRCSGPPHPASRVFSRRMSSGTPTSLLDHHPPFGRPASCRACPRRNRPSNPSRPNCGNSSLRSMTWRHAIGIRMPSGSAPWRTS